MNLLFLYSKLIKKLHGKCIKNSTLHKTSTVFSSTDVYNSSIGRYSYVGYNCKVINTDVGNFCSISSNVIIGDAEHPLSWASTSSVFQNVPNSGSSTRFAQLEVPQPPRTHIGHDVWIGQRAIIKAGVNIGNGAVIGSNAVVTRDVSPYSIVGGVPAHIIRQRFDEETVKQLEQSEWWDADEDILRRIGQYISNPKEFVLQLNKIRQG